MLFLKEALLKLSFLAMDKVKDYGQYPLVSILNVSAVQNSKFGWNQNLTDQVVIFSLYNI